MKLKLSNKPVVKKIKEVNRVLIDVLFPIETKNDEVIDRIFIERCLNAYSNKYRDNKSFLEKQDSLYILKYSCNHISFKEITYLKFSLVVPKEGLIDEFNLKEALEFFHDAIYDPCLDKNEFDKKMFDSEKEFLLEKEDAFPRDIYDYVYDKYYEFIDKDEVLGVHHDTYMKLLEKINSKELYEFYKRSILNNKYIVYIYGAVDNNTENTFRKVFNDKIVNYTINPSFFLFDRDYEYKHKEETTKYNQSALFLHYVIKDMKEKELMYQMMLYFFLESRENAILYNALRTDNNIIYSSKTTNRRHFGYFDVIVYYNDVDYKEIQDIITKAIKSLYDEDFFNECKKRLIKSLNYDLLYKEDEPFGNVLEMIETSISDEIKFKKKIKELNSINYYDFSCFLDRVVLAKSYLFKGGDKNV